MLLHTPRTGPSPEASALQAASASLTGSTAAPSSATAPSPSRAPASSAAAPSPSRAHASSAQAPSRAAASSAQAPSRAPASSAQAPSQARIIGGGPIPGGAIPGGTDCIGAIPIVGSRPGGPCPVRFRRLPSIRVAFSSSMLRPAAGRGAVDTTEPLRLGREPVDSSGAMRVDSSCGAELENSPGLNGRSAFGNEIGSALCGTGGGAPAAGRGTGGGPPPGAAAWTGGR